MIFAFIILIAQMAFSAYGNEAFIYNDDSGVSTTPQESLFADDRVVIKLADTPGMRIMALDYGVAYSEIRLLNPAIKSM